MDLSSWSPRLAVALALIAAAACGAPDEEAGGQTGPDTANNSVPDVAGEDAGGAIQEDSFEQPDLSSASADAGPSDAGGVDAGQPDLGPPPDNCPGGPGCACKANDECDSALCIDTPDGAQCARLCVDACPDGFKCSPVAAGGGDTLNICVPKFGLICNPCTASKECVSLGLKDPFCVDHGNGGAFCGISCDADGDCPADWQCKESTSVEGAVGKQCVRKPDQGGTSPGACPCSPAAMNKKLSTACFIEAKDDKGEVVGKCPGLRKCTKTGLSPCIAPPAQAESCDGVDNDCDSKIDEGTCDDGNPCTMDVCDPAKSTEQKEGCSHIIVEVKCDADDNICTEDDKCVQGICTPGGPKNCDDGNPCTKETCDKAKGCTKSLDDGAPCDDENPCTVGDSCADGACGAGKQKECISNEACVEAKCNLVTGKCKYATKLNGLPCDDGTACTVEDACSEGSCLGKVKSCDDKNPCTDDGCDPKGGCTYKPNKAPCDDNDACSSSDLCKEGKCVGLALEPAVDCKDGNACTDDLCDKKLGCVNPPNGAECDDGNPCTQGDACKSGKCASGSNACECETDLDCAKKEDGDLCNGTLICDKSAKPFTCKVDPKTVILCPKVNDTKCLINTCSQAKGTCQLKDINEGQPCDADGSVCTSGDKCAAGICKPGPLVNCDDSNPCTDDACDKIDGCVHKANQAPCEDGQGCTVGDTCKDKVCTPGGAKQCDDKDPCTEDFCDKVLGKCSIKPVAGCGGYCAKVEDCNDGNPCTDDACVQGKCLVKANSATCDDGDKCTEQDACGAGKCSGLKKSCDDGNPCTTGTCNPSVGCVMKAQEGPCEDGNKCTSGDACATGKCASGKDKACDDLDDCTLDGCDPNSGACVHTPQAGCGGYCKVDKDCDDGSVCTTAVCKSGKCEVTFNSKPCDDSNPCSVNDTCVQGQCGLGVGVQVLTAAGAGAAGFLDGPGSSALLSSPAGVAMRPDGSLVVADPGNHRVRRLNTKGFVSTLAGNGTAGHKDGLGALVQFNDPRGVAVDEQGNVYVADAGNHRVRRVSPMGVTITVAGSGAQGAADGAFDKASFDGPQDVAVTPGGVVYVADTGNHRIRRITATGTVSTLVGAAQGFADGFGKLARFNHPTGVAVDGHGNVFVADSDNHRLRKVTPEGVVSTIAGGAAGYADGAGGKAAFNQPWSLAVDIAGRLYVADRTNHRLRTVTADGVVSTMAGSVKGYADGSGAKARMNTPSGIAVDSFGTLYLADTANHRIRSVRNRTANCLIEGQCWAAGFAAADKACQVCDGVKAATSWTTLGAGMPCSDGKLCTSSDACDKDGACVGGGMNCDDGDKCTTDSCDASGACVHLPLPGCGGFCKYSVDCDDGNACTDDVCLDGKCGFTFNTKPCVSGGGCTIGDKCTLGKCVKGSEVGVVSVGGSGYAGFADGDALQAKLSAPHDVAVDAAGNAYVADRANHRVRLLSAAGKMTTYAGTGSAGSTDGAANQATFNNPIAVALSPVGTLYVVDHSNHRVRAISKAGAVSTVAGYYPGYVDGSGSTARFSSPRGLAFGPGGQVAIADTGNHRIRRLVGTTVSTLAGSTQGYKDGQGIEVRFDTPTGVAFDAKGNLYVADAGNHRVRLVTAKGETITVAGGAKGFKDEAGTLAQFNAPVDLGVDSAGNVYIADSGNFRLRKMLPNGLVLSIAGGVKGFKDGIGAEALLGQIEGLGVADNGTVYLADTGNHRVRTVRDSKNSCAIAGTCWAADTVNPANTCQRCNAAASDLGWSTAPDGKLCSDDQHCTVSDACAAGTCKGVAKNCDDADKCTIDACDPGSGNCAHKAIVGCGGYCEGTGDCDDGNLCTDDVCASKKCQHTFNTKPCKTGSACSAGDACGLGKCIVGQETEVSTLAGSGYDGYVNGEAPLAKFRYPSGADVDGQGNVYIADRDNHRIRKVSAVGTVTTLAGNGSAGFTDGAAGQARFYYPIDVTVDAKGYVFVADRSNCRIRRVAPDGTTLAWAGDGYCSIGDAWGTSARFSQPHGLVLDNVGAIYVADTGNHRVRKIAPDRTVTTLAGGSGGYQDGQGSEARFNSPTGIDIGTDGYLYVADRGNQRIRRVSPSGVVETLAGSGVYGHLDGQAKTARFMDPTGIAIDTSLAIYVSDYKGHRIRRISANGEVSTFAGNGSPSSKDGLVPAATFYYPQNLTVEDSGSLLVADTYGHRIRRVWASKGHCAIGGQCYGAGIRNPSSMCQLCQAATAADKWTALAVGTSCIDDSKCTVKDACDANGACKGTAVVCDDGDKCTTDSCDGATGKCVYKPQIGCGGYCGKDGDCDDGNLCTDALCVGGKCSVTNNAKPCSAGDSCSLGDHCAGGKCTSGMATWVYTHAGSGYQGAVNGPKALAQFNTPSGLAFNGKGELFIAEYNNNRVRKIDTDGQVTTFAGSGSYSHVDGVGAGASFRYPTDVTVDPAGNVWVADANNHAIRRISPVGKVVTMAGQVPYSGSNDGSGAGARFYHPWGIVAAPDGSVYVADRYNNRVRRVSSTGVVTTVAGSTAGYVNGAGSQARFNQVTAIDRDDAGNLFVADRENHVIRKISPAGLVSTVAGSGSAGYKDGTGNAAVFYRPMGLVVGAGGMLYVADTTNRRIRRITAAGVVTTVAGSGGSGSADGKATSATFMTVQGLTLGSDGSLFIADYDAHRIRRMVDSANNCFIDGKCYAAGVRNPISACQFCDAAKAVDKWQIVPTNTACYDGKACTTSDTCTSAGECKGNPVTCDDNDKCTADSCNAATGKCVYQPIVGCGGNCGKDLDCDDKNFCTTDKCVANKCDIQFNSNPCDSGAPCSLGDQCVSGKCKAMGLAKVTTAAGSGYAGSLDGDKSQAKFNYPNAVALATDGTMFIADTGNHRIRKMATSGIVSTLAGSSYGFADGKGAAARFYNPRGVAVDGQGVLYVADTSNHRIRKVQPDGTVTTFAGSQYAGNLDGSGGAARFNSPSAVAATKGGILFVADEGNHRIRRIAQNGYVTTLAGSTAGYTNGQGSQARFYSPMGLGLDMQGNLYVADYNNQRIRHITPQGKVTNYAGVGTSGLVDGAASSAKFSYPSGVAVDSAGRVWVADRVNLRIRRISADLQVSTVAGNGGQGDKDGLGTGTQFNYPRGLAVAPTGEVLIADEQNHRVRQLVDSSGNCLIGGFCWGAGLRNPKNSCQYCDAPEADKAWSTKAEGALCEDGKLCTLGDQCGKDGACTSGSAPNCDDGNKCTSDACNASTGLCVSTPIAGCS